MRTVFRLALVLVITALVAACGTYTKTYTYGPPPVPEPPAAPKMKPPAPPPVPEFAAADEIKPPTPPSPALQPRTDILRVAGGSLTDMDSTTITVTLGEYTYAIGADGAWHLVSAPMGVQPTVIEFSIEVR